MSKPGTTLIDVCIVAAVLLILFAQPIISVGKCQSQAQAMKMKYTWGPLQGCMIEVKPGKWVPLANYREVP